MNKKLRYWIPLLIDRIKEKDFNDLWLGEPEIVD